MANIALRVFTKTHISSHVKIRFEQVRYGHLRGKPPTIALSLQQRLKLLKKPELPKVNIGFSVPKVSEEKKEAMMVERRKKRANSNFEVELRSGKIPLNLEEVKRFWLEISFSYDIHKIATHYGIFQDLFGDAFFFPVVPLEISYKIDDDTSVKVYTGNVIKPAEASEMPYVEYKVEDDTLWTLVMCTPDGNLENSNNEYCHWFLGNIPGNKLEMGEQIIDYMKPFPARGVGYYRYIFILYKQNQRLDYVEYKKDQPCLTLKERNWNTLEFYRKYQDYITPAGLAFFQSDWDPTVREFYHSVLDTKEPIFQYDFPKLYVKPQTWFPIKEPFNLYLDRYRDPKDIMKEYLLRKLRNIHPFKEPEPPLKYPNAVKFDKYLPSWLKIQIRKERLRWGRVNNL
ncbi:39S ribosomal protein L38, mitochondrial [Apis mellifera caucasica]|uniref:Large ribosomal subunit protein mL38 n=1 Tax=Apis mellifera TaxID=7460 RepID=A0A7M7LSP1_APIME|nr:39S ribosomal protein L38, mitochondrial [Apis mellifera]XP_394204.2 39S ribosomal protein L38, mitochondrial [Apis mellifera]KAG6797650.1 39S ribosomal protein L38, mitochondrial [Apis mellifera caucasica]|eukprot:XP_006568702.1 39S ribosomal protein L38, mitochondrial [Apis mellifera]